MKDLVYFKDGHTEEIIQYLIIDSNTVEFYTETEKYACQLRRHPIFGIWRNRFYKLNHENFEWGRIHTIKQVKIYLRRNKYERD